MSTLNRPQLQPPAKVVTTANFTNFNALGQRVDSRTTILPAIHPPHAEIQMTQAIVEVAKPLGIAVPDHIIVGKDGHAGLRGLKLIQGRRLPGAKADLMRSSHHPYG